MDGVFPFLKPPGITSHDAVGICRRLLKEKRIGHSGTLDPLAYGVLPMFVGRATRLIEYTEELGKTYVAECRLGEGTDTEDSTGEIIAVKSLVCIPSWEELEQVLSQFRGVQDQRPSKYSSIKVNGQRAYDLARAGVEFTLPARQITIHSIELLAYAYPFFTIRVSCSSGTYIRALLRDIAEALGTVGMMTQLARTVVGGFHMEDAYTGEDLEQLGEQVLLPVDAVLTHMPRITISEEQQRYFTQGKQIPVGHVKHEGDHLLWRVYTPSGFMGIARREEEQFKVEKNIFV